MTYEERLQQLAEEMAKATCAKMALIDGSDLTWNDAGEEEKKLFIETHVPAARIAVAEMAKIAKAAYLAGIPGYYCEADNYIKEQGLIPGMQYKTAPAGQLKNK